MNGLYKVFILGGLVSLPFLAKFIGDAVSLTPAIIKNAPKPPKPKPPKPKPLKPTPSEDLPRDGKANTSYDVDEYVMTKEEYQATVEVRRIIRDGESQGMTMEVPSLNFPPRLPDLKCGSSELRHQLRSELRAFKNSNDFTGYAASKSQDKISDVFSKNIARFNPISIDARFLENDLTISIQLPCGIESFSASLLDGKWGAFETKDFTPNQTP